MDIVSTENNFLKNKYLQTNVHFTCYLNFRKKITCISEKITKFAEILKFQMLTIDKIGIEFGGNWLLKDASHQFKEKAVTGLIGRNGAGKSSLLRIIAGTNLPSAGAIAKPKDSKLRYFHQDLLSFQTERSIFDTAKDAFEEAIKVKNELDEVLDELEKGSEDLDLWDKVAHLQSIWEGLEGDKIDSKVYEILAGLGFKPFEVHQPYKNFSGGWRMRVLLAKMLLETPDILLLDEPTNHLDLPSIQWLESFLKTFPGICIIVSHDRYFLDRMVQEIVEISNQSLTAYPGNYTNYTIKKAERMDIQQKAFANQQKFLSDQQQFIDRFRAKASKARQVQSKIKQLDKVERVDEPEEESVDLAIDFKVKITSGREVLQLSDIGKSYGEKVIFKHSNAVIERGDKIALIGANGLGKTTLLRVIAGIEPHAGLRKPGHNVKQGFFAQHQLESLHLQNTILQELTAETRDKTEVELRTILGCFMFTGDEVLKKITVLSGGEKSRVALAKVLVSEANFLMLDEPTNHLDIQSIQILIQALQRYEGTFIVVSHDRDFLSQVANKIWYIESQELKEYPGTYEEYDLYRIAQQQKVDEEEKRLKNEKQVQKQIQKEAVVAKKQETPMTPKEYEAQKQRKNRFRKLQTEVDQTEEEISKIESEIATLTESLTSPSVASDYTKIAEVNAKILKNQQLIEQKTALWESLLAELETFNEE